METRPWVLRHSEREKARRRARGLKRTLGLSLIEKLDHYSIPEPNSGCLLWLGTVNEAGYGQLYWDGVLHMAHRLSLAHATGKPLPPPEIKTLHKCDVPGCIEPSHLFLGTQIDNIFDMIAKGRHRVPVGVAVNTAKLSEDNVRSIRQSHGSAKGLAAEFGVTTGTIYHIRRGHTWKSLL